MLEVLLAVLAQRAGEVIGHLRALVDIAADLADPALLLLGSGVLLGLDMGVVIAVGAAGSLGKDLGLHHIGDVEHLGLQVLHIDDLAGEDGVGIGGDIADAVGHAVVVGEIGELVHVPAALKAEVLEQAVGGVLREDGDVELARLHHHVAGVVLLDAGDGDLLRVGGGHLAGGVDDAAVVLAVHPGGQDLHAVGELGEDLVVHRLGREDRGLGRNGGSFRDDGLRIDVLCQKIGQGVQLLQLVFRQGRLQGDVLADELSALQGREQIPHDLAAGGSPRAVFDDGHLAVLKVVGGDVVQQLLHGDEDAGVVGGGGKDQVAAAEGVGDDVAGRGHGGVVHAHPHAPLIELAGQDVGGVLGVAVDGGVGQQHTLFLGGVAGPEQVLLQEVAEVAAPDEAVQRADQGNLQLRGLLQHRLDLGAVLAHDVGVVAPGLIQVLGKEIGLVVEEAAVQGAEGAEGVGGEEDLVGEVIGHHDFRPVDHGGHDKGEIVLAGGEGVALFHQDGAFGEIAAQELLHHGLDLGVADDLCLGIAAEQQLLGGGVVRLHVLYHQIIQGPAVQGMGHIFQEDAVHGLVHRIEQDGFLVQQEIGVVGDAVGHAIDALEAGETPIVRADPDQILGNFSCAVHSCSLLPCGIIVFGEINRYIIENSGGNGKSFLLR